MWSKDNWQPCCQWHHDIVKQRLERLFDDGVIDTDALCLDSAEAIEISRACREGGV